MLQNLNTVHLYHIFVFILLAFITPKATKEASEGWLQCVLVDFEGFQDSVYLLGRGNIYVFYSHPNTAPLTYNLIIDVTPVYTHTQFLPELEDGVPVDNVDGNMAISPQQQQNSGLGNHTVTVKVTWEETIFHCNKTLVLIEQVKGVYVWSSRWYVATDEEFEVMTFIQSGLPGQLVLEVISEDDKNVLTKERDVGKKSDRIVEMKMYLSDAGLYTIQATVYNELSYASGSTEIRVQRPIIAVSVVSDSPRRYPDTTVNFDIVLEDDPLPKFVRYDIMYGDGLVDYDIAVGDGVSNVNIRHSYKSPGLFTTSLSMYNEVSHKSVIASVAILQDINDVSLVAFSKQNGYATPQNILPLEYTVKLFANISQGTVEQSQWHLGYQQINSTSKRLLNQFPGAASYNITVTVWNRFSESTTTSSLHILESVTSLYLVNNGPVHLGNNITYVLFCKQQGSDPLYKVDFGDGSSRTLPVPQHHQNVSLPKSLNLPFDPLVFYSTVFSHLYQVEGRFVAVAAGSNLVSDLASSSEAFIQLRPCQIPEIHIRDSGSNYDLATKYKRNKSFLFACNVVLDCQGASRADYQWQIYMIDDISSVPSSTNEFHLPDGVNSKVTDLYIPKYLLDYGRYIFELTVVMVMKDGKIGVSNRDQSYIEVVQSPLVAKISGGSAITVGWSSNITLDGSESHDPDWPGIFDGAYHWYCHLSNETFPGDIDVNEELPTEGGCLGSGFQLETQSGNSSSKVVIEANTLPGNQTYTFRLGISQIGRTGVGWAKQRITILPGHPPALAINCLQNCDSYVNPSEQLALLGTCDDCEPHKKNKYTWSITSDSTLPDELVGFRHVSYGQRKAYVSIPNNKFEGSETYTLQLQIRSWTGASSFAEYTFTTNSAPSKGTCSISPSEGIVLETKFSIECFGFTDPEGPLVYEVHSYTGGESAVIGNTLPEQTSKGTLIYYGVDPLFPPTLLPIGIASNDYTVTIHIGVFDTLGANVETTVVVKVIEPEKKDQKELVEDTVLHLAQGEDSELHQLVDSGSIQSATQLINTVTSILNVEATKSLVEAGTDQQVKLEKRIEARESLVDNLVRVEVRDMESLELASAAMAQVTQQHQEVSIQAQFKMTDAYRGMGQFIKDQSTSGVGGQVVETSARLLVSGLSNMMGAANAEIEQVNRKLGNESTDDEWTELQNKTLKARNVTLSALSTLQDVEAAVLQHKVPGEEPDELKTDSLTVLLGRQENWQLDGLALKSKDGAFTFQLPSGIHSIVDAQEIIGSDDIIDTQMYHFKTNPFYWTPDSKQVTSQVTSLQLRQVDRSAITFANLPQDIDIILANDDTTKPSPLLSSFDSLSNQTLYAFNWTNRNSSVLIQVEPKTLKGLGVHNSQDVNRVSPEIEVCIQFELPPNTTNFDKCVVLPQEKTSLNDKINLTSSSSTSVSLYSWLLQPDDLHEIGMYFITIATVQNLELGHNHTVYAYSTQCLYWDEDEEKWRGDGCKVGPYTSLTHTHCQCNHLTPFALSFFVLPNALNLARDMTHFLQFLDNPVTVIAIVVVFILYAISAIWARRRDRIEEQQTKVIYLQDNYPTMHYRYHITIFTGLRKNAGTSAVVTLKLFGTFGSSDFHILSTSNQPILQRNSMDSFLITTHQSLGHLESVRVWHDNSGPSPEWYVSRILVHDLESDLWWYFLCRSWLAVDLGDCSIDKTFPVATKKDLNEFYNLVLSKTMRDLKDNHLWFSIFVKPTSSYFTRLQRASCCLSILLTSMMVNIMFYGIPEDPSLQNLELGTIQISTTNILIGVEASLISLPASIIIDLIFRNARPRYVAVPDPLLANTDSSLSIVAGKLSSSFRKKVKHFFSREHCELTQSYLPMSRLEISSSSTRSPSLTASQILATSSSEISYVKDLAISAVSRPTAKIDVLPSRSAKAVSGLKEDHTVMSSYDLCNSDAIKMSSSAELIENGSRHNSSAVIHQSDILSILELGDLDDNTKLIDVKKVGDLPEANGESSTVALRQKLSTKQSLQDKDSKSVDNSEMVLSSSWDLTENDSIAYKSHKDYLCDKLNECREFLYNAPSAEFPSKKAQQKACKKLNLALMMHGWEETSHMVEAETYDESRAGCIPWWCIYIGWAVLITSSLVCSFFIMLYGLRYGKQTSLNWLVAMVVSVIQNILIIQPIKVVVLAAVFAIALRTHQLDDVGAQFFRNWKPTKLTESCEDAEETVESYQRVELIRQQNARYYNPPATITIVKAREMRRIVVKRHSMVRALLGQIVFVFFILELAYAQQNSDSFYMAQALRDKYTDGMDEVSTLGDFYEWISDEFISKVYNEDESMKLQDSNLLIGSVRLRQIRVKPSSCQVPPSFNTLILSCKSLLTDNSIDRASYGPSWEYRSTKKGSKGLWAYQNGSTVQGSYYHIALMGYDNGGYVANLGTNSAKAAKVLTRLQDKRWSNQYSWALFVEWTEYNGNTNLFSVNTILFEQDTTGSLRSFAEFAIMRIHRYISQYDIFMRSIEGIYIFVVLVMMYRDYNKWKALGKSYFDFWNILNLIVIILSICAVGLYSLRHVIGMRVMDQHTKNRQKFVSFARVAFINQILIQLIALIVFFATLKCSKVLRYNSSIFMLQKAISNVCAEFLSFTFGLCIAVLAFASYTLLTFGWALLDFKTYLTSFQTLFVAIMGGFEHMEGLVDEFPIQAFFFFAFLSFFVIFVIFNIYVSFILSAFAEAKRHPVEFADHDVVNALVNWILNCFAADTHTDSTSDMRLL